VFKNEGDIAITVPNKHIVGETFHNSKHDSLLELKVCASNDYNTLDKPNINTHYPQRNRHIPQVFQKE
jgi:hypothetical protein